MKPLQQNNPQNNIKQENQTQQTQEKRVKIVDQRDKVTKPPSQKQELSREDFKSFLDNLQSKYQIQKPFATFNNKNEQKLNKQKQSKENENQEKDNQKKDIQGKYSEIEEDYEEDFESDYVENQKIGHQQALMQQKQIQIKDKEQTQKVTQKDYLTPYDQKIEQINNKNLQNLDKGTHKGFYTAFQKFNETPDLYFKYNQKDKLQKGQQRSQSRDKVDNKRLLNLPNQTTYKLQYSQSVTNAEQGRRIPSLPSLPQTVSQQKQNYFQQNNYVQPVLKEEAKQQSVQSQNSQGQQQSLRNEIQPIINTQMSHPQSAKDQSVLNTTQGNHPTNNYSQQQMGNGKFRIRKSDSATLRQTPKQAFFKNIYHNLNKVPNDDNPQIIKNSNALINDVFRIHDHETKSETKAVESALFIEIQNLKIQKNEFIQENNELREKVVNLERDIKQMTKQLQKWNIESRMVFDEDEEPYLDSQSCEKVYEDTNFYLISLRQKVKDMKSEINQLEEQIKTYNDTLRNTRTDIRAEQRQTELEKELMIEYQLYRESFEQVYKEENRNAQQQQQAENIQNIQNEKKECIKQRDYLLEQIKRVKDDNKVIMVEISLQTEMQQDTDAEIVKLEKKSLQRQSKLALQREEIKHKSPEDLQLKKNILRQKTIKMEEEKKIRNAEQQNSLIQTQFEKLNNLKFDFQEFRRKQILDSQQSNKFNSELRQLIDKLKEDYIKSQASIVKKKKLIKKAMVDNNNNNKLKVGFQLEQQNMYLQEDYQIVDDEEQEIEEEEEYIKNEMQSLPSVKQNSSKHSSAMHSKKPSQVSLYKLKEQNQAISLQKLGIQSDQNATPLNQSLNSTYLGNYGESQKSKYNNDEPISIIFGVNTIEV